MRMKLEVLTCLTWSISNSNQSISQKQLFDSANQISHPDTGMVTGIFQIGARRDQRKNIRGPSFDFGGGGRMKSGAAESNSGKMPPPGTNPCPANQISF